MKEHVFAHLSLLVDKEFGVVTLFQRVFGYPLIRQGIVVIIDLYIFGIHFYSILLS